MSASADDSRYDELLCLGLGKLSESAVAARLMLFLALQLGDEPCVFPAQDVVEVVPLVRLRSMVTGPDYLAGVFDYRGHVVPVVDLCQILLGRASQNQLSTRILVVRMSGQSDRLIGLIAESVTDTIDREAGDFAEIDLELELAELARGSQGLIQKLRLDRLLPDGGEQKLAEAAEQEEARKREEEEASSLINQVLATLDSEAGDEIESGRKKAGHEETPSEEDDDVAGGD